MRTLNRPELLRDERGVALPTAMISLMLLTTLLIAFAVLSKSEPTIASNQARTAQARALAEAGVERAVWALGATVSGSIPDPIVGSIAASPYNGAAYVALGTVGGFYVTVGTGTATNERTVDAVGYAPTYTTSGLHTAHRHIHLTLNKIKWLDPPSALAVRGELKISGSALIDSRQDSSCGARNGTYTTGDTTSGGNVYGYGDNTDSGPEVWPGVAGSDRLTDVPTSEFDQHIFTDTDLDMLRNLAKCCGTYLQGDQSFNAANPIPKQGLVFVDTTAGTNITCTGSGASQVCTPSTIPTVTITGNAAPTGYSEFEGWMIVNGAINWAGNTRARGLVYAVNDISYAGTETIYGAVISRNIRDTSSTNIDSDVTGNSTVQWDCSAAKTGAGQLPTGWFVKTGTYREVSD